MLHSLVDPFLYRFRVCVELENVRYRTILAVQYINAVEGLTYLPTNFCFFFYKYLKI